MNDHLLPLDRIRRHTGIEGHEVADPDEDVFLVARVKPDGTFVYQTILVPVGEFESVSARDFMDRYFEVACSALKEKG